MSTCLHLRNRPARGYSLPVFGMNAAARHGLHRESEGLQDRVQRASTSSRRAYTVCATPCSSWLRIWNARSSGKSHSPIHNGCRNCAWGQPPPAEARCPAAVRRSEKECLFSMVPPLGRDGPSLTTIGLSGQFVHSNPINCRFSAARSRANNTNRPLGASYVKKSRMFYLPGMGAAAKDLSLLLLQARGSAIKNAL